MMCYVVSEAKRLLLLMQLTHDGETLTLEVE